MSAVLKFCSVVVVLSAAVILALGPISGSELASVIAAEAQADDKMPPSLPSDEKLPSPKEDPDLPASPVTGLSAGRRPITGTEFLAPAPGTRNPLYRPQVGIYHQFTAEENNPEQRFSSVDMFVPLPGFAMDNALMFLNVRGYVLEDNLVGFNLGSGYRWRSALFGADRIAGVNFFYDHRDTEESSFHQLGFGWENKGPWFDFLGNFYFPVGNDREHLGGGIGNARFVGRNIVLQRIGIFDTALTGADVEVGGPLSILAYMPFVDVRAYCGGYHYQGESTDQAFGVKGRLETRIGDLVTCNFIVANDRLFDTTAALEIGVRFGGPRSLTGAPARTLENRLVDRVERTHEIVVLRNEVRTDELALNPRTGAPIVVGHASSNAAAGGDGSVEKPFNNLTALGSDPNTPDILFLHAGSVFTDGITLKDNQRLLGEGVPHTFSAAQGVFLLPTATSGTATPQIQKAPGDAVTLADNNEVSNLAIASSGGDGIIGAKLTAFNINRNFITGSTGFGINLTGVNGTGLIQNNVLTGNGDTGILVDGGDYTLTLTGNTSSNNKVGEGIRLSATTSLTGNIIGNTTNGNATEGIEIAAVGYNGTIRDNVAHSNNKEGLKLTGTGAGTFIARILNNEFANNNGGDDREFFADYTTGTGMMCLLLDGNVSNNVVSIVPVVNFNYEIDGNGAMTVVEDRGNNIGTIGGTGFIFGICP